MLAWLKACAHFVRKSKIRTGGAGHTKHVRSGFLYFYHVSVTNFKSVANAMLLLAIFSVATGEPYGICKRAKPSGPQSVSNALFALTILNY